jgi:hypothetical protein
MGVVKVQGTKNGTSAKSSDSVATILDSEAESITKEWLVRTNADENLRAVELDDATRSSHLGQLFRDVVHRLRNPLPVDARTEPSNSAHQHGLTRRKQGYSAAMLVEESRMLQVSIFNMLHKNEHRVDFEVLLPDIMVIADEVDLQLAEAMTSYIGEGTTEQNPMERSVQMF